MKKTIKNKEGGPSIYYLVNSLAPKEKELKKE